ncbi:PepSY domain-containing protein [Micrococcus sp. TA1]|uniref:PepSY domain-containing protein n=1 Tax=Micrococcus sp. TA1 TaxID=681627 RepID=UPI001609E7FD|nr:PepSY domain-containing protein [Micrococcus sp. TA1]MBB5748181.1 putative membrane protein YkoI [Micrococcus sp. TA1]
MTENTGTQTTYTKPLAMTGTGLLALALLTGCSTAEPEADGTPADGGATTTATATTAPIESSPAESSPGTGTPAEDDSSSPAGATGTTGTGGTGEEDPAYAAIDAALGQHPDAFVVKVDREDNGSSYEIEAHLQGEILDLTVSSDGAVREDGRDTDDDHLRRARDASVTAEDAARAALEGRAGQTIDEMELDDEGGTLVWKVELDRENGDDGEKLHVDAMTGEVTPDR